ncbi:MAG TPA: hypothetical protein DCX07_14040 [Phycisphaerales bacterium]|nr:hypothetical protein [Phycisphaerales bacterium]
MNTRERFQAVMNFRSFDRLPVIEWAAWWDKTIARWHTEGLPATITDRYDLCRHFELDIYCQGRGRPQTPKPKSHGGSLISSPDDYDVLRESIYKPDMVDQELWERWASFQHRGEAVLWFTLSGFFWFPRVLFGIEQHLYAFYDQPDLMDRINEDLLAYNLRVVDRICSVCTPDFMTFAEDMSYNHGAMISYEQFERFLAPFYRRIVPELHKRGILVIVDSDGDITVPAAWFRDVGVDGMLPLERQANVDMANVRKLYPAMRFIGHYDKMVMNKGEMAMRKEFERLAPTAAKGGFLISCDHQTPPGVSYRDYQLYLALFREYAAEAGRQSRISQHLDLAK